MSFLYIIRFQIDVSVSVRQSRAYRHRQTYYVTQCYKAVMRRKHYVTVNYSHVNFDVSDVAMLNVYTS